MTLKKLDFTEEFVERCVTVRGAAREDRCEPLFQAIALYKGNFLQANDKDWAIVLRHYYQTLYLDVCKAALTLLSNRERWKEMNSICEQAIEKYESFWDKMLRGFEMSPTERKVV
ncbi:MAG: hypothetical protein HFI31_15710 [Lachnospiraceae bacterium]|nr:hypothetical protein [Lachnospiraceae bacterium]